MSSGSPTKLGSYSSDSSSVLSSACSSYHAPCTPLRCATTPRPRPSPLFRLLQPFILKAPPNTPTQTSPTTTTTSPFMALHHPTPQSYHQPPSPTSMTGQRPPTPSRSERLLRDALMRDEMERHPASPLHNTTSPSPSSRAHRRRHSHIPTSALPRGSPRRASEVSPDREREEYTRGAFLFRTAMSNPRAPSPPVPLDTGAKHYYGGDAEGSPTQRHPQYQNQAPNSAPRRVLRSTQPPSARSTSHSPSPLRHRRQGGGSMDRRPPPLALDSASPQNHQRQQQQQYQQQAPPTGPGEPLLMTPHEQVLRARLERVLSAGRVVEKEEREKGQEVERQRQVVRERERRSRGRSSERGNEVRDEEGGWPWRERERSRGVWGVEETATTASPLYSSASNNSASSGISTPDVSHRLPTTPAKAPASHTRTRSKTDAQSPPPPKSTAVSPPRRSSTAPTSRIPTLPGPQRRQPRTGTTPPLVGGSSSKPTPKRKPADGEEEDDDEDLRLLTPPPTPPFTNPAFSFAGGGDAYYPSPYKTRHSSAVGRTATGQQTSLGRKNSTNSTTKKVPPAGLVLGSPRRPRNAPVVRDHHAHSSSSDVGRGHGHGHEHEHDEGAAADAECSSSVGSSSISDVSSSGPRAQHHQHHQHQHHNNHHQHHHHNDHHEHHRPQFNARKASARCRAMEGYVSFASVEGLGEPPADPLSPDGGDDDAEGGKMRGGGVLWVGWKKLLGVAGVAPGPGGEGVVL